MMKHDWSAWLIDWLMQNQAASQAWTGNYTSLIDGLNNQSFIDWLICADSKHWELLCVLLSWNVIIYIKLINKNINMKRGQSEKLLSTLKSFWQLQLVQGSPWCHQSARSIHTNLFAVNYAKEEDDDDDE